MQYPFRLYYIDGSSILLYYPVGMKRNGERPVRAVVDANISKDSALYNRIENCLHAIKSEGIAYGNPLEE